MCIGNISFMGFFSVISLSVPTLLVFIVRISHVLYHSSVLELFSYEKVKNGAESLTLISRLTNFNIMFSTCKTNIL